MKIYLATSWKNEAQPETVAKLRAAGHEVYDFKTDGVPLPSWKLIDPTGEQRSAEDRKAQLMSERAVQTRTEDMNAMRWADVIVALQPFGKSASFELGWGVGNGKHTAVLLADDQDSELMIGESNYLAADFEELLRWLSKLKPKEMTALERCRAYLRENPGDLVNPVFLSLMDENARLEKPITELVATHREHEATRKRCLDEMGCQCGLTSLQKEAAAEKLVAALVKT